MKRGSALLTSLLLIFTFSLVGSSLLRLSQFEGSVARNNIESWKLLHAAEGGVDLAIYALSSNDWKVVGDQSRSWKFLNGGQDAYLEETVVTLGSGGSYTYRVLIEDYQSSATIISSAYSEPNGFGGDVERQVRATYTQSVSQPGGMISKGDMKVEGSANNNSESVRMNGYDSSIGNPSSSNISDNMIMGSANGDIELKNTRIYGYIGQGGGTPTMGETGSGVRGAIQVVLITPESSQTLITTFLP